MSIFMEILIVLSYPSVILTGCFFYAVRKERIRLQRSQRQFKADISRMRRRR